MAMLPIFCENDLPNHLSELLAYVTFQPLLQMVFYYLRSALM
ncbi:hypothetical protein T03_872 [Trichinella britovi]|uniref:Uncharacterized protein n=1 Tax=Trichinella britovi TaxID=45882 RepID=A0A0V1AJ84_TRIBR|nr:hypothetical protein T03_872 [Trichinella britovi]